MYGKEGFPSVFDQTGDGHYKNRSHGVSDMHVLIFVPRSWGEMLPL